MELLIPLAPFIMVVAIIYINRNARHKETMAALEKGIDPAELNFEEAKKPKSKSENMRTAYLFVGAGFGIFVGHLVKTLFGMNGVAAYLSMAFLFAGLALIYFTNKQDGIQSLEEEQLKLEEELLRKEEKIDSNE